MRFLRSSSFMANEVPIDRRHHLRRTVLKRVRVHPLEQLISLQVHDLSSTGLMGEAPAGLIHLQTMHLSFDNHRFLAGQVRWIEASRFGMCFENVAPSLPGDPFQEGPDPGPGRRRALRREVDLQATMAVAGPLIEGLVRNISDGGARVQSAQRLPEGMLLLFELCGHPAILSRVQWSKEQAAGLKFFQPAPDITSAIL